jgi:hypothetical protein
MATAQTDASSSHLTGTVTNAGQTLAMTGDVAIGRSLDSMQMRMTMGYSAITRLNDLGIDDVKGVPARH